MVLLGSLGFNTQPPEGGWLAHIGLGVHSCEFQHTAARRRLAILIMSCAHLYIVSTHSRPKAAGKTAWISRLTGYGFNTQPPEGGWSERVRGRGKASGFNTQPPEGGWNRRFI